MKNWWLRFGCFLIGYNYGILRNLSEVSAKSVKRYTSALLIVCTLWSFIGYFFTERYIHGGLWGSFLGSVVFVTIIVQIERQIILSINPSRWLYVSRGIIAVLMAMLGAIIIDQIIFKEDIELEKPTFIEARIKNQLPSKTEELRAQIAYLDIEIAKKEVERMNLLGDLAKHPSIPSATTTTTPKKERRLVIDSSGKQIEVEKTVNETTTTRSDIPNPRMSLVGPLEASINNLIARKAEKDSALLNIRPQLEKEIGSKVGFLDELKMMWSLITNSWVAASVWIIWFLFLTGLEMLVLMSKLKETEDDYQKTIRHHMDLQKKRLDLLYANTIQQRI